MTKIAGISVCICLSLLLSLSLCLCLSLSVSVSLCLSLSLSLSVSLFLSQGPLKQVSRRFQESVKDALKVFLGNLKGVSRVLQRCFKEVSRKSKVSLRSFMLHVNHRSYPSSRRLVFLNEAANWLKSIKNFFFYQYYFTRTHVILEPILHSVVSACTDSYLNHSKARKLPQYLI